MEVIRRQSAGTPRTEYRSHNEARSYKEETPYQRTVKRLYALPILRERVRDNEEELLVLESLGMEGLRHCDRSVVRMLRPGMRIDPEEAHAAQLSYLRGRIAADELEIKRMNRALNDVCGDPYYASIEYKFFRHLSDEKSAEMLNCDPSTVRRNRLRLLKRLALRLYGVEAL